jgi:hypothetical protein
MEEARFDTLVRSFTAQRTRRGAARLLAGGLFGGLLTRSRSAAAVACTPETVATDCQQPLNPCKVAKCINNVCENRDRPAGAACPGGTCSNGRCICGPDFAACDGKARTGCEINIRTDPANCGACRNQCPGLGRPNVKVQCVNGGCRAACRGRFYDADDNLGTGCEAEDDDEAGHSLATAKNLGSKACNDSSSRTTFTGRIVSDARSHDPEPPGFNRSTGSKPDFWTFFATGGCLPANRDLAATIKTSGGGSLMCYRFSILNVNGAETNFVEVSGNDSAGKTLERRYRREGDRFYFKIAKVCGTGVTENVKYTITFHT